MDKRARIQIVDKNDTQWGHVGSIVRSSISETTGKELVLVRIDSENKTPGQRVYRNMERSKVEYLQPWRHNKEVRTNHD